MGSEKPFPKRLQKAREDHNLTQRELARHLSVSRQTVVSWENDDFEPGAVQLAHLGMLFGWDFNRVMTDFGVPLLDNPDRLGSEIATRPSLLRLFQAARELSNADIEFIADVAEARSPAPGPKRRGRPQSSVTHETR